MSFTIVLILQQLINLYTFLIFVWALMSWFNKGTGIINDIYKVLDSVVAPYVNIFRRFIPPVGGMDLSPLCALVVLQLVARALFMLI